jgi:hypothetical protein
MDGPGLVSVDHSMYLFPAGNAFGRMARHGIYRSAGRMLSMGNCRRTTAWILNLTAVGAIVIMAGCSSRVPLTRAVIKEYNLTNNDVTRLQLYTSDGLLLEKQVMKVDKDIDTKYALKKVEDHYIEQIYVKAGTPCIAKEAEADRLKVAFEPEETLNFVLDAGHPKGEVFSYRPDKKAAQPQAQERNASAGFFGWSVIGQEVYGDSTYDALIQRNLPYVLVDMASLKKMVIQARTLPGMRQGETAPSK